MGAEPRNTSRQPGAAAGGLLVQTRAGLYCPRGGFYIDPSVGVDTAVITHAETGFVSGWIAVPKRRRRTGG
jgi:hypothetical protein